MLLFLSMDSEIISIQDHNSGALIPTGLTLNLKSFVSRIVSSVHEYRIFFASSRYLWKIRYLCTYGINITVGSFECIWSFNSYQFDHFVIYADPYSTFVVVLLLSISS